MKSKLVFILTLALYLLASCHSARKAQFTAILNSASEQQKRETEKVEVLNKKTDLKKEEGHIDESIVFQIDTRLAKYQKRIDSVNYVINDLRAKIESRKTFRKEFKIIQTRIILLDSFIKNATAREYVFYMIDDGLDKTKRTLFEMAAFFGPGGYIIPEDKYPLAKQYFSPVIDSLMKFSNQYSDISRMATIVLNGYADATGISESSGLYKLLIERLGQTSATKEELNAALSELRAENLRFFLDGLVKERAGEFNNLPLLVFEYIRRGMGEALPDPRITDYRVDDERRRIVLCYWSVLPNE